MNELLILVVLLFLSAFFSGAEIALISLADFKINYLKDKKARGSKALASIRKDKQKLLITILIGNNVVNIAASSMATKLAIDYSQSIGAGSGVGIAVGIMTFLILVFGEIFPKALATVHSVKMALLIAPVFQVLILVLSPLSKMFNFITVIVYKLAGTRQRPEITEEEISILVEYGAKKGAIKSMEETMIQNIFKFDDLDVKEVMTPRIDMVSLEQTKSIKDSIALFAKHNYSRIPIFQERIDNIKGILYIKDVMNAVSEGDLETSVETLMKPAYFVPQVMSVDALFRQFQRRKIQMAIIVDEYGGISGLVTMEDLIEEIVGEIFDETEKIDPKMKKLNKSTWLIKGNTDIEEVNEKAKMKLEETGRFETISGHILNLARKIPEVGEQFEDEQAHYHVLKTSKNRISLIEVVKKDPQEESSVELEAEEEE